MLRTGPRRVRVPRLLLATGLVALALTGCGDDAEPAATSPATAETATPAPTEEAVPTTGDADPAAGPTEQQIRENWELFFAGATPAEEKVALLEDGEAFAALIEQQAQSPFAQATTARVDEVTVTDGTAEVTYTILLDDTPALVDQTGQAVLVEGTWRVGKASFCSLLALQGTTTEECPAAAPAAPTG